MIAHREKGKNMHAQLYALFLFFATIGVGKSYSNDCISREEFEKFKTEVFSRIGNLSSENKKQAKHIEDQKKTILELKTSLSRYGNISEIDPHAEESATNSTEKVALQVLNDGKMDSSSVPRHVPSRRAVPFSTYEL